MPITHAGTWREAIHELASFERPSASEGERRAALWIAARVRAAPAHPRERCCQRRNAAPRPWGRAAL